MSLHSHHPLLSSQAHWVGDPLKKKIEKSDYFWVFKLATTCTVIKHNDEIKHLDVKGGGVV